MTYRNQNVLNTILVKGKYTYFKMLYLKRLLGSNYCWVIDQIIDLIFVWFYSLIGCEDDQINPLNNVLFGNIYIDNNWI